MFNQRLLTRTSLLLAFFSTQAAALPFQSLDPRALSMGGTGTASGTSANAGFMNPALLAVVHEEGDFNVEFPVVGGRLMDKDDLLDKLDSYQDNKLESNLTTAIATFNGSKTDANAAVVAEQAVTLRDQLNELSNKSVQGEFSAGFVVGVPGKKLGASLSTNTRVAGGGMLTVPSGDIALLDGVVTAGQTSATALDTQLAGVTNVVDTLTSNLQGRGATVTEVSLALAREVTIGETAFAVGITPKYQEITTFDYLLKVNEADFDAGQGKKEFYDFNFDLGVARDYENGWKVGMVVKNIIPNEYDTEPYASPGLAAGPVSKLKIEPQARLGVSHATKWTTVALDVDLNKSEFGFDSETQYIGLGAELDVFETVQLRLGYRHNMSDSTTSMPTVGMGLSPFGVHIDIAAAANRDEIAGALQLGFQF